MIKILMISHLNQKLLIKKRKSQKIKNKQILKIRKKKLLMSLFKILFFNSENNWLIKSLKISLSKIKALPKKLLKIFFLTKTFLHLKFSKKKKNLSLKWRKSKELINKQLIMAASFFLISGRLKCFQLRWAMIAGIK